MAKVEKLIDHLFRKQYGKMVSILTKKFGIGFLDAAEDAVQEAMITASQVWSYGQIPPNPEAWLMTVAQNKALNMIKREKVKDKAYLKAYENDPSLKLEPEAVADGMLSMIFACCHPAIHPQDQVALVLKTLSGFSSAEIASALLMSETAINKRIYRAKEGIKKNNVKLDVPTGDDETSRIHMVCTCIYLMFNEGYNSKHDDALIREEICLEALSLGKLLSENFPASTETAALMALMCFHIARFESRLDNEGAIVIFAEQDRTKWNLEMIELGATYLNQAAQGETMTSFHLEALIAQEHCRAKSFEETNWEHIALYYNALYKLKPSPVILLNLAVVTGQTQGPVAAIDQLNALLHEDGLRDYYLLYATLGEFQILAGQTNEALGNLNKALGLTNSAKEQALIQAKIKTITQ